MAYFYLFSTVLVCTYNEHSFTEFISQFGNRERQIYVKLLYDKRYKIVSLVKVLSIVHFSIYFIKLYLLHSVALNAIYYV